MAAMSIQLIGDMRKRYWFGANISRRRNSMVKRATLTPSIMVHLSPQLLPGV